MAESNSVGSRGMAGFGKVYKALTKNTTEFDSAISKVLALQFCVKTSFFIVETIYGIYYNPKLGLSYNLGKDLSKSGKDNQLVKYKIQDYTYSYIYLLIMRK